MVYLFIGGVRTRTTEAPCNMGLFIVFTVLVIIAISYDHITLTRNCCGQGSKQALCETVEASLILKLVIFILKSGWIFITLVIVWHWRWKNLLSGPPELFFWDLNSAQWPFWQWTKDISQGKVHQMTCSNDPGRMHSHTLARTNSQMVETVVSKPVTRLFPRCVCHHLSDLISLETEQHDGLSGG